MKKALTVFLLFTVVGSVFAMDGQGSSGTPTGHYYPPCSKSVCEQFSAAAAAGQVVRSAKTGRLGGGASKHNRTCVCEPNKGSS